MYSQILYSAKEMFNLFIISYKLFNDKGNTRPLIESLNSIISTLELIEKGDGKNNELTSQLKDNVKIYYSEKLILIKKLQLEMLK